MLLRRTFLQVLGVGGVVLAIGHKAGAFELFGSKKSQKTSFPYQLSDAEWQKKLTPEQYKVLRKAGTERSRSSPLDNEKRAGVFHCAGCDQAAYSSEHKYDSGTGWPSFSMPITEGAIETTTDYKLIYPRTEVHCSNCGGHFGHVFKDGPPPSGERHCLNGVALDFKPSL